MESQSFVLATGLDLWGASTQPSQSFDLLPADFRGTVVLSIMAVLAGAVGLSRRAVMSVRMSRAWT